MEEELQKVKSDRSLLKKTLIKEREDRKRLERRVEELDSELRTKDEELEALQLLNSQLDSKCQNLQEQMKGTAQGWSLWKSRPSDEVLKLQHGLTTLQDDLRAKIEENELVHTKNFEMRERFKTRKAELKAKVTELDALLDKTVGEKTQLEAGLAGLKKVEEQLRAALKKTEDAIALQQSELSQKQHEISTIQSLRQSELQHFSKKLKSKISLDDTGLESLTVNDAPAYSHIQMQKAKETFVKCEVMVSSLSTPAVELLSGLEGRFALFTSVEDSKPMRLAAEKTGDACGKLKTSVEATLSQLIAFLRLLYTLQKGPRDVQSGRIVLLDKLKRTVALMKTYHSFYTMFQKAEAKLVQNPQELKQINIELLATSATFIRLLEDFSSSVASGFWLAKKRAWLHSLHLLKSLFQSIRQASITWAKRLGMDSRLQYPSTLKALRSMNDNVLSNLTSVVSVFEQLQSAAALLENVPEGCWYFLMNPFYSRGKRYLEAIRQDVQAEGVPYSVALANLETLRQSDGMLEEQRLEVASLEKQLADSHKEEEKIKATVRKLQNDMLVLASASQESQTQVETFALAREPDMISEDVRNGIQRMAARLIDFGGEALPIEKLTVEQDLMRQLRTRAVETIRQLSASLLVAEKKIATLERELTEKRTGVKSPPSERNVDMRVEVMSQKSMSQKSS